MARKSLKEVLTDSGIFFPDNNTGQITPTGLRTWIAELIGAISPGYAYIVRPGPTVQAMTAVPAALVFDTATVTNSGQADYTANAAAGEIVRVERGTTRLTFTADITPPTNSNSNLTFTLFKNGVATVWRVSVTLTAIAVKESVSMSMIDYNSSAAIYTMHASSNANGNYSFSEMELVAEVVPVWEYI